MAGYIIAFYIRLSMEDSKTDSMSIANQRLALRNYAQTLPEYEGAEILEFVDNGYSGTSFERPAVQELLELVQSSGVDFIIVKDFSRFGRNSIETGYFIERVFPLFHTRFVSLNDHFDSNDYKGDTGGINVAFQYLINEQYSRDLSKKSRSAKYAKMQRGEYQSKVCSYGYRKGADNRLEIDEETAPVVRLIFECAASGHNAMEISQKLYDKSIPTPGEHKAAKGSKNHDVTRSRHIWQRSTILRMLEDERYAGTYIMGKRAVTEVGSNRSRMKDKSEWYRIPNHHPAIVDMTLFEKVQATTLHFKCLKKQVHLYPLRSKVFCGCCGHALYRTPNTHTFSCRFTKVDPAAACHDLQISESNLESVIYTIIQKQAQVVLQIGNRIDLPVLESAHCTESGQMQQIQRLEADKRELYEQLVKQEIAKSEYQQRKSVLDRAFQKAKQKHSAVRSYIQAASQSRKDFTAMKELAAKASSQSHLTREIVEALIQKVEVFPENRIEIQWKVKWDFPCIGQNGLSMAVAG